MGRTEQTTRAKPPSNSKAPPPPPPKQIAFKGKGKEIPPPEDLQETEEPYFSDAEYEEELKYSKKGGPMQKKAPSFDRMTKEKGPSKKESLPQIKQKSKMGGKDRLFNQEKEGEEEGEEEIFLPNIQMQQVQQKNLIPPIIIKEFVILDHIDKQSNEFTIEVVRNQI
jgi:hypothetical protein